VSNFRDRLAARVAVWRAEGGRRSIPRRAAAALSRRAAAKARRTVHDGRRRAASLAARLARRIARVAQRAPASRREDDRKIAARVMRNARSATAGASSVPEATAREAEKLLTAGPVIDLCCGDGRLLGRLTARGVDAVGLDCDPAAVEVCRSCGKTAYQLGWPEYLGALPEASIGGIFASQNGIWLDEAATMMLLMSARRVLREDGALLVELAAPPAVADEHATWTSEHPMVGTARLGSLATHAGLEVTLVSGGGSDHETELILARPHGAP
jgi:SAM-dependent methyltransferase